MIIFKKSKIYFFSPGCNNVFIMEKKKNKNNRRCEKG